MRYFLFHIQRYMQLICMIVSSDNGRQLQQMRQQKTAQLLRLTRTQMERNKTFRTFFLEFLSWQSHMNERTYVYETVCFAASSTRPPPPPPSLCAHWDRIDLLFQVFAPTGIGFDTQGLTMETSLLFTQTSSYKHFLQLFKSALAVQ
jgi:hypothetical protein